MNVEAPKTDKRGSFKGVIGMAPESWPWALHHYYAVNVSSDPGNAVVGWSASPDGSSTPVEKFVKGRSVVETVGYWDNAFDVTSAKSYLTREEALEHAKELCNSIHARFLMSDGEIISENREIQITGFRPEVWDFLSLRDLGVFLAYLDQRVRSKDGDLLADQIKASISFAWPATELLVNYCRSLELAREKFADILDVNDMQDLNRAYETAHTWLHKA